MKQLLLIAVAFLVSVAATADTLLAQDGKAAAALFLAPDATLAEATAAKELSDYIEKVSGAKIGIASDNGAEGPFPPNSIFIGPTAFAKAHGIDVDSLGPDEWVIRSAGDSLILAGGRPRGTVYAVAHFLEDEIGVHWWNPFEESVPRQATIETVNIDRRGKPVLRYRDIYAIYANDRGRFASRNRLNRQGDVPIAPEFGGEMGYGPPYHVHTFYMYVPPDPFFKTHPEWFSLVNGKRDADQKQLCLTNPELRAFMVAKLKDYIEAACADAAKKGLPAPTVFDISQNDWMGMCECDVCQAIAKAEGSESGVLLDFLNYAADAIKTDYPDIYIDSLAYMMTQKPPKNIRPRDNIILRLCDTGSNFTRPVTDDVNKEFREHLSSWAGITKNLRIWNYAVTYAPHYGLPLPTVHTYAPNYRFYAEHNVEGVFTEHEYPVLADMRDFKVWMMMKLLEDPYQDYAALVQTFTEGFYGPAGALVRQYLDDLQKASDAKLSYLSMAASPGQYHYLDVDFVVAAQGLFQSAEEAVQGDEVLLQRVRHARLPLDRATVVLYPELLFQWTKGGRDTEAFPLNRDAVAERYKNTWFAQVDFRCAPGERAAAKAEALAELGPLLIRPAIVELPEKFRGLPPGAVYDYTADVSRNWQDQAKRVPDADAESGVANRLELSDEDMKRYALPMPWGLYDQIGKRGIGNALIRPEDVAGSGYNWYKMGEFVIKPSYYVYFFWSWNIQVDVENAMDPNHPDAQYEIWARIKFEGPGFPHAKPDDKNAICIERVVLKMNL